MLPWLLRRIGYRETPVSQNKQYSAEILEILLQSSSANRARVADLDGVDTLLQAVSAYRKRDPPKDTDEAEFMENVFDCLTCMVREVEGKNAFVAAEGVELCLIMLCDGRASKPRALRLLDHALQGQGSDIVGQSLVEAAGLKTIFGMLMKKVSLCPLR
jgi:beta-catenin-like protein 1